MALADKLSDHRSNISDSLGLQEIYLSDQLHEDFSSTGELTFTDSDVSPDSNHAEDENDDDDPSGSKSVTFNDDVALEVTQQ